MPKSHKTLLHEGIFTWAKIILHQHCWWCLWQISRLECTKNQFSDSLWLARHRLILVLIWQKWKQIPRRQCYLARHDWRPGKWHEKNVVAIKFWVIFFQKASTLLFKEDCGRGQIWSALRELVTILFPNVLLPSPPLAEALTCNLWNFQSLPHHNTLILNSAIG